VLSSVDLTGKRALVTGAGKRVGRAIALALGKCGMHVAVHHHQSHAGALETCTKIAELGGTAFPIARDLLTREGARSLADEAIAKLVGLDLFVGSAANFERIPFHELEDAAYDRALDLNLTANYLLAQRTSAALCSARGSMVFVTCASTATPLRNYLPYVVSKGALRQLMRALALELAPNVRVNAVAPGTVLPPEDMPKEALERIQSRIPLGHFGSAEDIASAVVYLASAPFVTGVELMVDGGRSVAGLEKFG
jgi:pteridine reductase